MPTVAPYGSWRSPITIDLVASEGAMAFSALDLSTEGVYWLEARPAEKGRSALVFQPHGGEARDVVPPDFNVRTRVHEYGGGAWWRHEATIFCSRFDDSRLYRIDEPGGEPVPITPEPEFPNALRYADGRVFAGGRLIVCVRESHGREGEPRNELVVLPTDGSWQPRVIASGRDFYAAPRPSPNETRLAFLAWDHPLMPFEGTELFVAELAPDGTPGEARLVAGSATESVVQPEWSPSGELYFCSDRDGWWNLWVDDRGEVRQLSFEQGDIGFPAWAFDLSRYAFLDDGRIACIITRNAVDSLELLDPRTGVVQSVGLPYTSFSYPSLKSRGTTVAFAAASPAEPSAVITLDVATGQRTVVRRARRGTVDPRYFSNPEAIEFEGADGVAAHAFWYPPTNPDFEAPNGELPPLVVAVHGGPTAHVTSSLSLPTQFFTSRGIGVVDVNYGGSTGYGREYRHRLRGRWGEIDVDDSVAAAAYLVARGEADGDRVAITGGSAGGYTTLLAVALRDEFAAGMSAFGVADLVTFHEDTHKFESHYDEYLVGPWPDGIEVYRERSPVNHADGIECPLLLLQGLDDKVVPPSQSEQIVEALDRRGIPYAYIAFEGEGHGFRKEENVRRAAEARLSFLAQVFGFEPADDFEPIEIEHLERARA